MNAALTEFARDLAQEINSPLAAAISEIGFVATRRGSGSERDEALAAALESLAKVRRIVERVQRLGRDTEAARPLDAVVRAAVEPLAPLLELRAARLELDLQPTRPLGNASRLAPVVSELVCNATRAVTSGGTIVVRVRQLARRALLTVLDDGRGMSAEIRRRVFEPAFAAAGEPRGMGLGLPLCRSVVLSCGGTIDLESRPGKGTEVVISLPSEEIYATSATP